MAYDAALGTRINDLGDLSTQGDVGPPRSTQRRSSDISRIDSSGVIPVKFDHL